ncbi:hypothetical protein [Labilibaculum antarcticum]|uniref:Glycosyltransferase RgtA/B/C/D-like domain-containing protein n=1 Tax=Labilibaculum antarcticum TaxID=1717717 RepID=A0A1Y1CLX4_9BACT|nr:hypothetical protein [Labilibaculum antarcticum]BAX81387.1 hypothetical protein ALGA_3087 [Labilibaculum antarcticum]
MKIITQISFWILLFLGIIYAGLKPNYNWDMIAYMGCVVQNNTPESEVLHKKTYEILRQEMGDERANWLSAGNNYRETMESDHNAFSENLPFYTIRVVYLALVGFFFKLGIPLSYSTVLPSLISVFFIILIVHRVLSKEFNNTFVASVISIIVLFLPQTIHLARLSTPDALSTLLLLLITVMYIYNSNWFLIFLVMALSIMTRTDNIIWCGLLLFFETFFPSDKKNRWLIISFGVCLIVIYFTLNVTHENGGWEILFYHSFIQIQNFPLSLTPALTFKDYVVTMIMQTPDYFPWFLSIILAYYYLKNISLKELLLLRGGKIVLACIFSFSIKYVLFPSFDSRFYFVLVFILFITFIVEWKKFLALYHNSELAIKS